MQRRRAAPAVRVGVLVALLRQQQAAGAQVGDQLLGQLGVLDEPPLVAAPVVAACARVERAVGAHGVQQRERLLGIEDARGGRDAVVVLAERRRDVHDPRAVLGRDELVGEHRERPALAGVEDRAVVAAVALAQLLARESLEDLGRVTEHRLDTSRGEQIFILASPHAGILGSGRDRQRDVSRQRPWRRRPHEQLLLTARHRQLQVDARVDRVLVAERDLVGGERRLTARAVGHDLVALVEQAAPVDLRQRPPDRLDVALVERAVGVLEIDPEADPLGQPVPLRQEREHRLAALLVESRDPVLLDLRLVPYPELLFDGDLDRQAVAVPAALALDAMAAHRLKARVDVLEHAREHVVGAGRAVGRRRALVEDPPRRALARAQRLGEHVALAPALQHSQLERRQLLARVDLAGRDQRVSLRGRHGAAHCRLAQPPGRRSCGCCSGEASAPPARTRARVAGHQAGPTSPSLGLCCAPASVSPR